MDTMKVILPDGTSYMARYSASLQRTLPAPEVVTSGGTANAGRGAWSIPDDVLAKFPDGVEMRPNKSGVGYRWNDGKGNGVRIDMGEPGVSQAAQQVDHVVVNYGGKIIGRDGKPIVGSIKDNALNAHIPLSEYQKWSTWYKP
jgi:filamentous hemagglutinin